jgi:hypothetical protein
LISVPRQDIENSKTELFLDFKNDPMGEAIVNVKSRFKDNPELEKQILDTDEDHPNIVNIFVDTASRDRFWRKYKRLTQFFTNMKNDKNIKAEVYEHKMLTSMGGWTKPNMIGQFYGAEAYKATYNATDDKTSELYFGDMKSTWNYAQDQGYMTGFFSDICDFSGFNRF